MCCKARNQVLHSTLFDELWHMRTLQVERILDAPVVGNPGETNSKSLLGRVTCALGARGAFVRLS
jgi:hypothetical protein